MATTEQIALEYYNKGMDCMYSNNIENGIENLSMAKTFYKELEDDTQYVLSLYGLSIGYGLVGLDAQMIQAILEGLSYINKKGIKGARNIFYTTICNQYMRLKDFDSAINYGLMAIHDLENYGELFPNKPSTYLVAYLNLAYSYLETCQYDKSEKYLLLAENIAHENDIHYHDFTFEVARARIEYAKGDKQYVFDHIDDLMNFVKNYNVTIDDFVQDLDILIGLFIKMELYDNAIQVAQALSYSAVSSCNNKIKLETSKLFMRIYKAQGDSEKYKDACVMYAEDDIALTNSDAEKRLLDLDTSIAISIASTPDGLI